MNVLLYDFERDEPIKEDETVLVYEDGTTEHIKTSRLYKRAKDGELRQQPIKRHYIRSRSTRGLEHRKAHARQVAPRKRIALRKA